MPLTIKDCSFVSLHQIRIYQQGDYYDSEAELPLVAINIMGESYFNYVHYYHGEMQLFLMKHIWTESITTFQLIIVQ